MLDNALSGSFSYTIIDNGNYLIIEKFNDQNFSDSMMHTKDNTNVVDFLMVFQTILQ